MEDKVQSKANALARLSNPKGFEDNNDEKIIVFQAAGKKNDKNIELLPNDRHVLLRWTIGVDDGKTYTQVIHLTGGPGLYSFQPQVKIQSEGSLKDNTFYELGRYTREQRDQIVALAGAVKFKRDSVVDNCQTWMGGLLNAMVEHGLLSLETFNVLQLEVPALKPV